MLVLPALLTKAELAFVATGLCFSKFSLPDPCCLRVVVIDSSLFIRVWAVSSSVWSGQDVFHFTFKCFVFLTVPRVAVNLVGHQAGIDQYGDMKRLFVCRLASLLPKIAQYTHVDGLVVNEVEFSGPRMSLVVGVINDTSSKPCALVSL